MDKISEVGEYKDSIMVPALIKAQKLSGGKPELYDDEPIMYVGGFCVVFPYIKNSTKCAVRCWHQYLDGAQERTRKIADYLSKINLPYFVGFEYIDDGIATSNGVMPLVVMDWVDANPLKDYIEKNLYNTDALKKLADNFLTMVKALHENSISHGDLQHGNIMVKDNGEIILVDYDSMYVPALNGYKNVIAGLAGYQHPARFSQKNISPKSDYFSELVIYTSILALIEEPSLWNDLQMKDTETMLFSSEDISSNGYADIFNRISKYDSLSPLVDALRNSLTLSSIEDLSPLESVICADDWLDELSEEWASNGYVKNSSNNSKDLNSHGPAFDPDIIGEVSNEWNL